MYPTVEYSFVDIYFTLPISLGQRHLMLLTLWLVLSGGHRSYGVHVFNILNCLTFQQLLSRCVHFVSHHASCVTVLIHAFFRCSFVTIITHKHGLIFIATTGTQTFTECCCYSYLSSQFQVLLWSLSFSMIFIFIYCQTPPKYLILGILRLFEYSYIFCNR